MFQTLSKKLRKKQGFTLIELIVVLAILGIILAIAVPNYLGVQAESSIKADINSKDLVVKATKLWYAAENITATEFAITGTESSDITITTGTTSSTQLERFSNYLEAWPTAASPAGDLTVNYSTASGFTTSWDGLED